jgi:RNA polymerase sigma-70 factor (ECF subfamily)
MFDTYAPFVWRVLRRLGVRGPDIEDVCQEVFLVVHRRLPEFRRRSSFRTWIYGISTNLASEYRRRPHHRREDLSASPPEPVLFAPQDAVVDSRRALDRLDAVLDELDEAKRTAFVLHEIEGLPMSEVAAIMGCPLQTAYSRAHAARKQVDAAMKRVDAGGSR